jgi:membrane-associated protease RseP (regulator of RpoE activity)
MGRAHLAIVALAVLSLTMIVATFVARWLVARALGVRGVRFPFGAGTGWSWTTTSLRPPFLCFAGSVVGTYLVAGSLMAVGTLAAGEPQWDESSMRVAVAPGGPADRAGVRDGDRIDAVDGAPIASWDALKSAVSTQGPGLVTLTLTRDGRSMRAMVTPEDHRIGVTPPVATTVTSPGAALRALTLGPAAVLWGTARGFVSMAAGTQRVSVSGPSAIVRETAAKQAGGAGNVLRFLGAYAAYIAPVFWIVAAFGGPGRRRVTAPARSR